MITRTLLFAVFAFFIQLCEAQTTKTIPNVVYKSWPDSLDKSLPSLITKGEPALILVWNSMMKPTKYELDSINVYAPAWKAKHQLKTITIAAEYDFADVTASLRKFSAKNEGKYKFDEMLVASYRQNNLDMGINSMPFTYVVNRKGEVIKTFVGFDGAIFLQIQEAIEQAAKP